MTPFDGGDNGGPDDNDGDDPAVFEPDPDDFGPDELDPDADEGAEANDDPGEMKLPIRPWSPTQTKIRVPVGTISGATEADPTSTDLITKWMTL